MRFIPQFEPLIKEQYAKAVYDQIISGWIGSSKKTSELENKISEITGAKYCLSTTSGTIAIILALYGLNIPKNKTILFPSYTFLAGANAAKFLGYNVEFVDVDKDTLSITEKSLLTKLKNSKIDEIGCLIFVNHNGYVGEEVLKVKNLCDRYNIKFLEDSSQALGIKNAGMTGDVGIFSFSVPKIITTGQGGVMFTNNEEVYKLASQLRDHGDNWRKTKLHDNLGINLKFDDIHAAYGLAQLEDLDNLLNERKRIFEQYKKHLKINDFGNSSTWMIIHYNNKPNEIIEKLAKNNIQAVQYYKPINHNKIYSESDNFYFIEANWIYNNTIYLPSSLNLTNDEIDNICDIIKKII